ncbi:uncharacterized protein HKW66_Vig0186550 [Vigna angularis]|uniref:Uncharacterized protein n=1 Tax=Phaseolus angularis TaxID=3914 RepID=A0A8T0KWM8_PHAAN|nr:uncharacterized protein HKW66_Vig0186550 [Vigna angularis]
MVDESVETCHNPIMENDPLLGITPIKRESLVGSTVKLNGPLVHTSEYMFWCFENAILFLSIPQMLNDPRMHRASTSTHLHSPEFHKSRDHENILHAEARDEDEEHIEAQPSRKNHIDLHRKNHQDPIGKEKSN